MPKDTEAVASFLSAVTIFAPLDHDQRVALAERVRRRAFAKDEVIFHREDPSAHLFMVVSGAVKVAMLDDEGHAVVIAIERTGDVFGELALLDEAPRSATISALTPVEVLALSRVDFLDVLERDARATRALLALLARTVRRASGLVEDLVFLDVPGRVAKCLVALAQCQDGALTVDLRQDDLAALVGATRMSVNRALADFEQMGAIAVARGRIEVRDADALARRVHT